MAENPKDFPKEFGDALSKTSVDGSVWFGRLLANGYKIDGFRDKDYSEGEFRQKLNDGEIIIEECEIIDEIQINGMNIKGKIRIKGEQDGKGFNETFKFEHKLKKALRVTKTSLTKVQ